MAILLYNIWRFVETFNVEVEPHHMLWYNTNLEFPTKVNRINYVFLSEAKNNENYNEMIGLQEKFLEIDLDHNDMEIEYESEEEVELKHKSYKKVKSIVIEQYK